MVYIVCFDLIQPGQKFDQLLQLIKQDGKWARLGRTAYLIDSESSAVELRDRFKVALDGNDKIYVGHVSTPAAWTGMSDGVSQWIKNKLNHE